MSPNGLIAILSALKLENASNEDLKRLHEALAAKADEIHHKLSCRKQCEAHFSTDSN